jgi:hypothetical protein
MQVLKILSQLSWLKPVIPASQEVEVERSQTEARRGKSARQIKSKRTRGVAQVVG